MKLRNRLERLEAQHINGTAEIRPLFIVDDFADVGPDADVQIPEDLSIGGLKVERAGHPQLTFWRQPGETLTELRMRGAIALQHQSAGPALPFAVALPVRELTAAGNALAEHSTAMTSDQIGARK